MFNFNDFLSVVDPLSLLYAVLSGLFVGFTVLLYLSLRFYIGVVLGPWTYGATVILAWVLSGTIFFTGQTIQAYVSGDPQWERVIGRFVLWLVFSFFSGIGLGYARSFAHRRKRL